MLQVFFSCIFSGSVENITECKVLKGWKSKLGTSRQMSVICLGVFWCFWFQNSIEKVVSLPKTPLKKLWIRLKTPLKKLTIYAIINFAKIMEGDYMLRRKIFQQLTSWKEQEDRNPLIIKGCRQCGKTFAVQEFASKNYESVIYINFIEKPEFMGVFSGSLDVDYIRQGTVLCLTYSSIPSPELYLLSKLNPVSVPYYENK